MQRLANKYVDNVWLLHAIFYLPTAIWPLVHMRSFEAVSGPKFDHWLVRTVAALLGVIGVVIGSAGTKDRITPEVTALAIGSSTTLAVIDVVYVSRGRISRVYLLEALAEVLLIAGWIARWRRMGGSPGLEAQGGDSTKVQ